MNYPIEEQRRKLYWDTIPVFYRSMENWPSLDPDTIADKEVRKRYDRLTKAATLFLNGQPIKDVLNVAGVGSRQFYALMNVALSPMRGANEINGTRAFKLQQVQKPKVRHQPFVDGGGFMGMFGQLLREFPQIEKDMIEFLNGKERPNKVTPLILHKKFLKVCRTCDVPATDYPFNTKSAGYKSLQLWYKETYQPNFLLKHVGKQHGPAAAVAARYEMGDGLSQTPPLPYTVWVIDEFKVDLDTVIELPMARWDVEYVALSMFQVLRLRSIGSVCCNIAWHMCLRKQAAGTDVVQLFKNAVLGQPKVEAVEPSMQYEEGAGFPQNLFPELGFVVPILVYLDNALSHLFNPLQDLLQRLYGGRVILGIPGSPKGRPDIESAISRITRGLIHQLPGTTGTGPGDPLRKQAAVPVEQRVQVGLLEQALDVYLANENVTPSASAGYLEAFTRLQRLSASGQIKCNYLPETKRRPHHFSQPKAVTVHRDLKSGRLPHIFYEYRRYSSAWLKRQPVLNIQLWALADYSDLRTVILVDDSGAHFATLTVEGAWSRVPHDLHMLQIYAKRKSDAEYQSRPGDGPLFGILTHLAKRSHNDRDAALEYAYIMRYLKHHLPPEEVAHVECGDLLEARDMEDTPLTPVHLSLVPSRPGTQPVPQHTAPATLPPASPGLLRPRINIPRRLS